MLLRSTGNTHLYAKLCAQFLFFFNIYKISNIKYAANKQYAVCLEHKYVLCVLYSAKRSLTRRAQTLAYVMTLFSITNVTVTGFYYESFWTISVCPAAVFVKTSH